MRFPYWNCVLNSIAGSNFRFRRYPLSCCTYSSITIFIVSPGRNQTRRWRAAYLIKGLCVFSLSQSLDGNNTTPEPTTVSCKCVIGKKDCCCRAFLTDDDETGCLEELLVVPGGVFGLQDVADPVVLPEPQGGVQRQTWDDSKHFLPDGKRFLRRDPGWVVHPDGCVLYSGRVHLTVNDLMGKIAKYTLL